MTTPKVGEVLIDDISKYFVCKVIQEDDGDAVLIYRLSKFKLIRAVELWYLNIKYR